MVGSKGVQPYSKKDYLGSHLIPEGWIQKSAEQSLRPGGVRLSNENSRAMAQRSTQNYSIRRNNLVFQTYQVEPSVDQFQTLKGLMETPLETETNVKMATQASNA